MVIPLDSVIATFMQLIKANAFFESPDLAGTISSFAHIVVQKARNSKISKMKGKILLSVAKIIEYFGFEE